MVARYGRSDVDTPAVGFSIRGGGVRGALSAAFLADLFEEHPSLRARVKVWGGTSTGGCIALGYAAGLSPEQIVNLYRDRIREIFASRGWWDFFWVDELRRANYDNKGLIRVMRDTFGDTTMGELCTEVAIPTVDLLAEGADQCRAMPVVLTRASHPNLPVWKAAVMTSSAPTFFPSFEGFVDGGIAANNPCMLTYGVLRKLTSSPKILDIGNGAASRFVAGRRLDYGLVRWGRAGLIPLIMEMNERATSQAASRLLAHRYREVDCDLGKEVDLDDVREVPFLIRNGHALANTHADSIARWARR
jgi:hypothetical protein